MIKDESMTTVMPESKLKKVLESGGKPDIDPINQLSSDKRELVTSPMEEKAKGMSVAQLGDAKQTKTIDRSMAPSSVAADAAKLPGTGLSGTQTETTPMMGQLPPGSGPGSASGGPGPGIGVPAPTTTPPPWHCLARHHKRRAAQSWGPARSVGWHLNRGCKSGGIKEQEQ